MIFCWCNQRFTLLFGFQILNPWRGSPCWRLLGIWRLFEHASVLVHDCISFGRVYWLISTFLSFKLWRWILIRQIGVGFDLWVFEETTVTRLAAVNTSIELSPINLSCLGILKQVQNTRVMHKALMIWILIFVLSWLSAKTKISLFLRRWARFLWV